MKFSAALHRRFNGINLPGALLLLLLQRTPILNLLVTAENTVLRSPASAVLKSAAATLGALGAVHSLAGATEFVQSPANPVRGTVGTLVSVAFTISGSPSAPNSFTLDSPLPPGFSTSPALQGSRIPSGTAVISGVPTQAGTFNVSVTGTDGSYSRTDTITFIITGGVTTTAPSFTTQPTTQTVTTGATVTFTASADGSPAPTLQWRKNGAAITGQSSATLTLTNVATTDAGSFTCVASKSAGTATSSAAVLTVNPLVVGSVPVITAQPVSLIATLGANVNFTVTAAGAISQQWRKNGTAIAGATTTTLTLNNLTAAYAADYDVVFTNASGSVTSAAATLLLNAGLTSRLSNVAVRTTLAANQVLTVGLTVSGGAKSVLIRAAGPGLGALGVPGTMADPKLALFNGSAQIAANDNWGTPSANVAPVSAAMAAVGAFPFASTASLDAALVTSIDGGRTVQVSGPAAGNLIVEAYDAGTGNTPRLTNLSALNFVGTGGDVLIAGFTIAGTGSKNVLIRAVGPALANFGVTGTLADPTLTLYSGATALATNDNWLAADAATMTAVGAFTLSAGSKDAAIVTTLPAGAYTAVVSGIGNTTGTALVELYVVP
jgi:hypothetical protein